MDELTTSNKDLSLASYDLDGVLPDLNDAEPLPIDLVEEYWTPEQIGESKRVFFKEVIEKDSVNEQGEPFRREFAVFIEQDEVGTYKVISNATVRLVQHMKDARLKPGTPIQITYTGKKKTRSGYNIDTWQIRPLRIPGHDAVKIVDESWPTEL